MKLDFNPPLRVTRDVTSDECRWLKADIAAGTDLFRFDGATYGCINHAKGVACSMRRGKNPFFELPKDAVELVGEAG